jgi:hypothetical protein
MRRSETPDGLLACTCVGYTTIPILISLGMLPAPRQCVASRRPWSSCLPTRRIPKRSAAAIPFAGTSRHRSPADVLPFIDPPRDMTAQATASNGPDSSVAIWWRSRWHASLQCWSRPSGKGTMTTCPARDLKGKATRLRERPLPIGTPPHVQVPGRPNELVRSPWTQPALVQRNGGPQSRRSARVEDRITGTGSRSSRWGGGLHAGSSGFSLPS